MYNVGCHLFGFSTIKNTVWKVSGTVKVRKTEKEEKRDLSTLDRALSSFLTTVHWEISPYSTLISDWNFRGKYMSRRIQHLLNCFLILKF